MNYLLLFGILLIFGLLYLRVAKKLNIVDIPNRRSSHTELIVRGGGIIFPVAAVIWWIVSDFKDTWMIMGLVLISGISFWDDLRSLSRGWRFFFQFLALSMAFYNLEVFSRIEWYFLPFFYFFALGVINAINFMDGINGITGLYSLVFLGSILSFKSLEQYLPVDLIEYEIIGITVFLIFNLRKRAMMFAGDVGSISLAYLIIYFLSQWFLNAENWTIILFLLVYGIDVFITMFLRFKKGERLTEPHRTHLYQILVNELGFPHVRVALIYAGVQLAINFFLFIFPQDFPNTLVSWLVMLSLAGVYLVIRCFVLNSQPVPKSN